MLAAQLGAMELEVVPCKIQNSVTLQQLTTCFANQGQIFYIKIFCYSSNSGSSNMLNAYLAKQLEAHMTV